MKKQIAFNWKKNTEIRQRNLKLHRQAPPSTRLVPTIIICIDVFDQYMYLWNLEIVITLDEFDEKKLAIYDFDNQITCDNKKLNLEIDYTW